MSTVAILAQGTTSWLATRSPFLRTESILSRMVFLIEALFARVTVAILPNGLTWWLATRSPFLLTENTHCEQAVGFDATWGVRNTRG
jgi:hypothetical protein